MKRKYHSQGLDRVKQFSYKSSKHEENNNPHF
jgi:hypothetical protein